MTAPLTACPLCGQPFGSREATVEHLTAGFAHSPLELATALLAAGDSLTTALTSQLFAKSCHSQSFDTQHAAVTHALAEARQVRRAYLHRRCGKWHLTRKPLQSSERTTP